MKKIILSLFLLPVVLLAQDISNLEMNDINGDLFIMQEHLNHDATIISFWATWCLPCKKEHPTLQELKKKYKNKDIQVILISRDSPRSLAKVKSYAKTHPFEFIYLLDPNGEISNQLLVTEVPYTMLVNRQGKVVFTHSGYRKGDEAELEKEIVKILGN